MRNSYILLENKSLGEFTDAVRSADTNRDICKRTVSLLCRRVMEEEACYDIVVLGAGVQGSATAYYLIQKAGVKKVLLLEQVS